MKSVLEFFVLMIVAVVVAFILLVIWAQWIDQDSQGHYLAGIIIGLIACVCAAAVDIIGLNHDWW